MAQALPVTFPETAIRDFCLRHHIRWMALFGSALRDDFTSSSDLDVLVEFEPDYVPGLIRLGLMEEELEAMLGRDVDLLTPRFLHPGIRERVLGEARILYDAA